MAISDCFASTIIKVRASFGFSGFECLPEEITSTLGITPDEIRTKGERRKALKGTREILVHESSWTISSRSDSKDVNDHLRMLLNRLEQRASDFAPEWGEPDFGVLWKGNYLYQGSGPFYERDVLAGISALGASLYQDIYQVDQDDDEIETPPGLQRLPKDFFS